MIKSATELLNEMIVSAEVEDSSEYKTKLKTIETIAYLLQDKANKLSQHSLSKDQKTRAIDFMICRNLEIFNTLQELLWLEEKEKNGTQNAEMPRDYSLNLFEINGNKRDGFKIKGPIIPKKTKMFQNNEAFFLSRSLRVSVKNYLEKNRISTPVYSNADVIFTLNYPKTFPDLWLPDADNLETKGLLDALGMLIIENDGVSSISSYTIKMNRSDAAFNPFTAIHINPAKEC